MDPLSIGQVAKRTGVSVETIRFYERQGLIPEPARSAAGYRQYPADTPRRVRFIQRAKAVGFTLGDIRELLELRTRPDVTCADIRERAQIKLDEIGAKLSELEQMRRALTRLAEQCSGEGALSECPILDALEDNDDEPKPTGGAGL